MSTGWLIVVGSIILTGLINLKLLYSSTILKKYVLKFFKKGIVLKNSEYKIPNELNVNPSNKRRMYSINLGKALNTIPNT